MTSKSHQNRQKHKLIDNCLQVLPATHHDYARLSHLHYCIESIRPFTQIYKICGIPECRDFFPDPMAVIVYKQPIPDIRPRRDATKKYFKIPPTEIDRLKLVNKKIQYIARLIVDPRFHKIGLASWLLKDSLERQTIPIIETLTPIDFTNKIFQKAGFKLYQTPAPAYYQKLKDALRNIGIQNQNLSSPTFIHARLKALDNPRSGAIEKEIKSFLNHFKSRRNMLPTFERTEYITTKLQYPNAYLIWFNPNVPPFDTDKAELQRKNA